MTTITARAHGFDTYVDEYKRDGLGKLIVPKLSDLQGQIDFVIPQIYQAGFWKEFPILWDKLASPCAIRGHYTYQVSWMSWLKQAEEVLAHTPADCQFMVLDVEKIGNVVEKTMLADAGRILRYWQDNKPANVKKILYYANPDIYVNYILPIMGKNYPQDKWYLDFDIWVSQWPLFKPFRSPNNNPALPTSMRGDWKIYQYTDAGDKKLYSAADLDVFNGPVADMRAWLGLDAVPPPPVVPQTSGTVQKVVVNVMSDKAELIDVLADDVSVKEITTFTLFPYPVAQPDPEPTPDGKQYALVRHKPRDVIPGRYAPDTVTMQDQPKGDGKGASLPITPNMWKFLAQINDSAGFKYARSVGMMWINGDYQDGIKDAQAERIICGGNFVEVLEIRNDHALLRTFKYTDKMQYDPVAYNWHFHPELFFKAVAINKDGNLIKVASGVDCHLPLLNRNDETWIQISPTHDPDGSLRHPGIELFPTLPLEVHAETMLDIFDGVEGTELTSAYPADKFKIYNYALRGCSVWGQAARGWICLLIADRAGQRIFPTSWRLETVGVIPDN